MKRTTVAPIFTKKAKRALMEGSDEDSEPRSFRFLSWNVAGARAWVKKNGHEFVKEQDADLVFLSETKCNELPGELLAALDGYYHTMSVSKKAGYSGVALLSKKKPIKVTKGIGHPEYDEDGRVIIAEYNSFFFVGAYVPNSGRGLVNLEKRAEWEEKMREKLKELDEQKPVIYGGDLNVAHEEIDLANPKSNRNKTAGFTDQEREDMTRLLGEGFLDTWREQHPTEVGYTFWSHMGNARARNIGWRLDYFLVSKRIKENVRESVILPEAMGSDHCAISLLLHI